MNHNSDALVAVLVEKLGGDVEITSEEIADALADMYVYREFNHMRDTIILRTRRRSAIRTER